MATQSDSSLLCHRCGQVLTPGSGDFWVVRIDAVCDPSPPPPEATANSNQTLESLAAEYEMLIAQMSQMSERELMDQVHRRMTIHLCAGCYRGWIESPV